MVTLLDTPPRMFIVSVDNVDMQLSIISLIIFSAFQENLATN